MNVYSIGNPSSFFKNGSIACQEASISLVQS